LAFFDQGIETASRDRLIAHQVTQLQNLLAVAGRSPFYRRKLHGVGSASGADVRSLEDLRRLPFTTKSELVEDQEAVTPFGSRLTEPIDRYARLHQTSGTTGKPLRMVDTPETWDWWLRCWSYVYRGAGVGPSDRVFAAFSFGPFIGFWAGFEAASRVGALQIPGGGQTTEQRIQQILDLGATVLLSTPTYAIRMAETARDMGVDLTTSNVRLAIHAGEPGASIPSTRARLEQAWGMEVFDHPGATEVGAWGFECTEHDGVHLIESEYIFEVVDPTTGEPADDGELIITNLGRGANPVIRYRTGDRAQLTREPCSCGRTFSRLRGGVLGRVDDMLIVRGVNLFPSAIENIVRRFDAVDEFVVEVYRERELDEMEIRLEASQADGAMLVRELASQVHVDLGFRPKVTIAPQGSLPRFELKARRVFDRRG
jgi:phenylacetate-CoA ligase